MINPGEADRILKEVLSLTTSDMAEAILERDRLALSRFSENRISDSIDTEETTLYVRCINEKRIGVIATGDITPEGVKRAVIDCELMLRYMIPDEQFVTIPKPMDTEHRDKKGSPGTDHYEPSDRAEVIRRITGIAQKGNLEASGAYRQEWKTLAVANTLGVNRMFTGNHAQLSVTISGKDDNSGWGMAYNPDAVQIDGDDLALVATRVAMNSRNPKSLHDGKYTVILSPAAVGQLLILLSFMGFGCKTLHQKRSFMAGRIGEKIAGENFTVYDDANDESFASMTIDYEGTPRQKVSLIENGVAKGVVYNSYYANLMETKSTGHALPPTNTFGPYPKNLVVAGGERRTEDLVRSTQKGLLINHFWYLNYLNPLRTMVTGTTRDGLFLVENGEITSPVRNMRTNQSILEAFSNIEEISSERVVYPQFGVLMTVTAMKINEFNLVAEEEETDKC